MTAEVVPPDRVLRREDERLLHGRGTYVANWPIEGECAYICFARSPYAHARVLHVDTEAAREAPGVLAVFDASDCDFDITPMAMMAPGLVPESMVRPALAGDRVRFVGEAVAMVVAKSAAQAVDAADQVFVDCEPLTAVTDPFDALMDEVLLFPDAGTNVMLDLPSPTSGALDSAEVVVSKRISFPRIAAVPLEGRSVRASWDGEVLTMYLSAQGTGFAQLILANSLGLSPEAIRLVVPDVGGAFGAKSMLTPDEVLVAWAAKKLGTTVHWTESRTENLLGMPHGRAQHADVSMGATRDGKFTGLSISLVQEAGAYPEGGMMLPNYTRAMAAGPYVIPRIDWSARTVATNATPISAFRGAGRPEATFFLERIIDALAAELSLDPVDIRQKNLVQPDAFPYTTAVGTVYDSGNYPEALSSVVELADYNGFRIRQQQRVSDGSCRRLGIGVSVYVELANPNGSSDSTQLALQPDGSFLLTTPATPYGQGLETTFAQIAATRLGVGLELVHVRYGDTSFVLSPGTGGSKSTQTWGVLSDRSAAAMVEKARHEVSQMLEAAIEDIVYDADSGSFHVNGSPSVAVRWAELADKCEPGLSVTEQEPFAPTYPFGAHACVVEVDIETGRVEILDVFGVDDCGRVINPMLVEGQVHGGLAQGLGFALMEHVVYDADGNPLTSTLADYAFPSAADLPSFTLQSMETPAPGNSLGVKGAGELGALGSTCAVANAVVDALRPLGVDDIALPVTAERVWRAIVAAGQ